MTERVLCVDDDSNLLEAYQRQLRKSFEIDTALGGEAGLDKVRNEGPYSVVVSDMRMPGMDGVQFLTKVRELAPETVRMMLTGNADVETAMDAVNEGYIFRFLTKPCPRDTLIRALEAGIAQHRLLIAERELLSNTLSGSVKLLTDILVMVNPTAFGRASRVRDHVKQLALTLNMHGAWQVEVAAMLSQVGCVAVPEELLAKVYRNEKLDSAEMRIFENHPIVGRDLLKHIPRLDGVAKIVGFQEARFDGSAPTNDGIRGEAIPLGARILKLALDFDALATGLGKEMALAEIEERKGWYDPTIIEALQKILASEITHVIKSAQLRALPENVVLAEDVRSLSDTLLMAKGQTVSPLLKMRLATCARSVGVKEPIRYFAPLQSTEPDPRQRAHSVKNPQSLGTLSTSPVPVDGDTPNTIPATEATSGAAVVWL